MKTAHLAISAPTARTSVSVPMPQGLFTRRARLQTYGDILGALHVTVERLELVRARMVAGNPPDYDGLITNDQYAELRTLGIATLSFVLDDLDIGLGDRWAALMLPDDVADDSAAADQAPTVPAGL